MITFIQSNTNGKLELNVPSLVAVLNEHGFCQFATTNTRDFKYPIIRNNNGVLEMHTVDSVKEFVTELIRWDEEEQDVMKHRYLNFWMKMTPRTIANYLKHLLVVSETGFGNTGHLKMFRDTEDACFIPFRNGVVKVTAQSVRLLESDTLKDQGCVWETSILPYDIELHKKDEGGVFSDFVTYAMKHNIAPQKTDNNISMGCDDDDYQSRKDALETGYGYLLHGYNPPDELKAVILIDKDSDSNHTEGGNGKSVILESVGHFRNMVTMNGKQFKSTGTDSSRFNFSSVKLDTQFVLINDLKPDFEFSQLFNEVADDMTVEGKGINKIVIPKDKKPKIGITTNHIIEGTGNSFKRRQHIVEVGNFWNLHQKKNNGKPKDIIGKTIGGDFDEKDWNDFFNFGFRCIRKYLANGLIEQVTTNYEHKQLIREIEGEVGDGTVVDWIINWFENDRSKYLDGIAVEELYSSFTNDCFPHEMNTNLVWDYNRFHTALYDLANALDGYEYNPHLAKHGSSKRNRRWKKGSAGQQVEWVIITHKDDVTDVSNDQEDDYTEAFQKWVQLVNAAE